MTDRAEHGPTELSTRLREIAERLGTESVPRSVWTRETGLSDYHVLKHFDSWNGFVEASGLKPDVSSRRLDDEELFAAMRDAFLKANGVVTRTRLRKVCRYSDDVYAKRWGRWQNVLARFRQWAEDNEPDFPYLADLPADPMVALPGADEVVGAGPTVAWKPTQRTQYGPFLNFRGLQHAPSNEQGVVFLFGMVAFDLGYVVEGVGTGYPDCEAKRCVSKAGDVWERVRVEFEFRSRNFLTHGHDPAACDVIVCWEHNWPDCPIEVLELRSAIDPLGSDES